MAKIRDSSAIWLQVSTSDEGTISHQVDALSILRSTLSKKIGSTWLNFWVRRPNSSCIISFWNLEIQAL